MKKTCHPVGRALTILFTLASLGMIFLKWTSTGFSFVDPLKKLFEGFGAHGFGTMMGETDNLIYLASFVLLILFALISILLAVKGRIGGGIWYFLAALFAFCVIFYAVEWSLSDLCLGAWLFTALAAAGLICSFFGRAAAPAPTRAAYAGGTAAPASPALTWTCPACGTVLAGRERFCTNCGKSRSQPEASAAVGRCSFCGAALRASSAFCPDCGRPVPKPAPAAKPRCAVCGAELSPEMAFCTNCGTAVGPRPAAVETETPRAEPARVASANPAGFHSAGEDDL